MPVLRHLVRTTATTAAAVLACTALGAAPAIADDPVTVPDPATVTLTGDGSGHGTGLSQYGAYGAARKPYLLDYKQILDFYYPGTKLGEARGKVKVWISDDDSTLVVKDQPGLTVRSVASGRTARLDGVRAKQWRIREVGGGRSEVAYKAGGWHAYRTWRGDAEFRGRKPLELKVPGGVVSYRGTLRSATFEDKRVTVNVVPLEAYVRGVLPAEVPASIWPQQALRAQAVAARAYAVHEREHTNRSAYDLCDDAGCQEYGGVDVEWSTSDKAVSATARQVVTWHGEVAFAQFSASNGGWTVGKKGYPYLPTKRDKYEGTSGDYYRWEVRLSDTAIEDQWSGIGNLTSITIDERDGNDRVASRGGRVQSMILTGDNGSIPVAGETFQRRFGLRSTMFEITGVEPR